MPVNKLNQIIAVTDVAGWRARIESDLRRGEGVIKCDRRHAISRRPLWQVDDEQTIFLLIRGIAFGKRDVAQPPRIGRAQRGGQLKNYLSPHIGSGVGDFHSLNHRCAMRHVI